MTRSWPLTFKGYKMANNTSFKSMHFILHRHDNKGSAVGFWKITEDGLLWMGIDSRPMTLDEKVAFELDLLKEEKMVTARLLEIANMKRVMAEYTAPTPTQDDIPF
jgi:hypothetical protein